MIEITSSKGNRTFRNTERAAEWLLIARPEEVAVNGVNITDICDWDAYGITLGVLDYAVEYGNDG